MNILITSLRAPITLEWAKLFQADGHKIFGCDSFRFPIGRFIPNIQYFRLPEIKKDFQQYQKQMKELIAQVDLVIPTCEDIFWLAQLELSNEERQKCFMPSKEILLRLHHKYHFFELLPQCENIAFPTTKIINNYSDIIFNQEKTILKPVYSRFGQTVIRNVMPETCQKLDISPQKLWVQQQYITGESCCNFFIAQNGRLILHSAYKPKWLINNAAASFFEPIIDERIENFAQQFCQSLNFTGQAAFDFIDDGKSLWVLECNPRSTSGLHIFSGRLKINNNKELSFSGSLKTTPLRIGLSLPLLFSLSAIKNKQFKKLWQDFRQSEDVLSNLPFYAAGLSFAELNLKAWQQKQNLSAISTYDIEYNGED
ncbi:MAG: ATP-grasp domain-containing protein [Neisseriaceae bacterium]|nr:ATP-grasp domain-containing protein [Neisseriaceae bacterium]